MILRRSRLVVTPEGMRLERRTGQSYVINESARWTDIAEFFAEKVSSGGGARGQLVIGYVLTPLGQQIRSRDSATPQLSQQVNEIADRGTVRERRVYLPVTLWKVGRRTCWRCFSRLTRVTAVRKPVGRNGACPHSSGPARLTAPGYENGTREGTRTLTPEGTRT